MDNLETVVEIKKYTSKEYIDREIDVDQSIVIIGGVKINCNTSKSATSESMKLSCNIGSVMQSLGNSSGRYVITTNGSKIGLINITSSTINQNTSYQYSIDAFNSYLKKKQYNIVNPSKDIAKRVESYTNVISLSEINKIREACKNPDFPSYRINFPTGGCFFISEGSTGNCQMIVVGYTDYLMKNSTDPFKQLTICGQAALRRVALLDIKDCEVDFIMKYIPKGNVISHMKYLSTNKSNMNIYLVRLSF